MAGVDVPHRIGEPLLVLLALVAFQELLILIDVARNDIEIEALRGLRFTVHEQRQAFRARIAQPFLDGEAIALRLRNLLALVVEEQFVIEPLRRAATERTANVAGELYRIDEVLAGHFVVDAKRQPAHRPVGLPLQLALPAGSRRRQRLAGFRVVAWSLAL